MKQSLQLLLLSAVLAALAGPAGAASVSKIASIGEDGDESFYHVACSDKTQGSVVVSSDPPEVCAHPAWEKKQCRGQWSLERAAAHVCQ